MNTDQTIVIDSLHSQMQFVSAGEDGESLLGRDGAGNCFEFRILTRVDNRRKQELARQLSLLKLAKHNAIRCVIEADFEHDPPTYKLELASGLDPVADRLSNQIENLSLVQRLQIAVLVIDACVEAHRIGLCQGGFPSSSILISNIGSNPSCFVDFCGASFCDDIRRPELSLDNDLIGMRQLMSSLLTTFINTADNEIEQFVGKAALVVLRNWLSPNLSADGKIDAPTSNEWKMILAPLTTQQATGLTTSIEQTSVLDMTSMSFDKTPTGQVRSGTSKLNNSPPKTLGRFSISELIGEGGMGTVYLATDQANGEQVAIKVLRNTSKSLAQSVRRFRKEARLLADVQNDHVIRLIEVGEDSGTHYIAMEFVAGIDLKRWLAGRAALSEDTSLQIMADLSRALVGAHAAEVVHRDIKPENVLLKLNPDAPNRDCVLTGRPIEDFTLKLTDFGIARHVNQTESMEVTRAGSVMGTPKYMSPEQCRSSSNIGPAADVYSLGITMYELMTGQVPFVADDFIELASMHCCNAPPPIQRRNAKISDAATAIVHRSLAKSPTDRFGDAAQLLAEILKVQRGLLSDIAAHPKFPDNHQSRKLWEKTMSWNLKSAPAELWPLVSNTERLNEAIGFPSVNYRTVKDPQIGIRKFGSFVLSGVKVSWEEHPFEWIEGERMGILREFDTGPFQWFMSVVTLEATPGGGTKLSHQVRIEPRNLLGRVLTKIEADWRGFRNLAKVYDRMDRSLRGRLEKSEGSDAFRTVATLPRQQASRLRRRIERVIDAGANPVVASALMTALEEWSSQELSQLRPLVMGDRLGVEGSSMIDACLIAATEGLLNLRWDILCPTCRTSAIVNDKLAEITAHTHCDACDVDFQSNLSGAIELIFQAHPEIRKVNEGKYCIGGPEHSPHVVAQVRIDAGECLNLNLNLQPGDYLIRGPRIPRTQTIRVQSSSAPSSIDFELSKIGAGSHTPKLRNGSQTLTFHNDLKTLHVVRVERMIPRNDVVTASMASANPLFRRLFPDQKFSDSNPVETETLTFLATCINNLDQLYLTRGETATYGLIQKHHDLIRNCVIISGGAIVKTVGEKVLSTFSVVENSVIATERIRESLAGFESNLLELGIGIHCGPTLVTTQNSQLDYFGGTIRAVFALPELSGSRTLITEAVYTDPVVAERLGLDSTVIEQIDLPGSPNTRVRVVGDR